MINEMIIKPIAQLPQQFKQISRHAPFRYRNMQITSNNLVGSDLRGYDAHVTSLNCYMNSPCDTERRLENGSVFWISLFDCIWWCRQFKPFVNGNADAVQLSLAKNILTVKLHPEKNPGYLIKYWYEIERVKWCPVPLPHKTVAFKYQHDLAYVNMWLSTSDEFWWDVINKKLFRHKLENRIVIGCAKHHIFPDHCAEKQASPTSVTGLWCIYYFQMMTFSSYFAIVLCSK